MKHAIMSSKSNKFSASDPKKTPIKFGGFGNLYKHTHTFNLISLPSRLRAGLYGFSCIAAREADLFFLRKGAYVPTDGKTVGDLGRREATQGWGLRNPPCPPLQRGKRKATQNLGPAGHVPKGRYLINRRSRPTAAPRQANL